MTYKLLRKETNNKAAKYYYTVIDETGKVISERSSNREYVACTIDGSFYFGRLDLIGKGDHAKRIFYNAGNVFVGYDKRGKRIYEFKESAVRENAPIAYLDLDYQGPTPYRVAE
jgi:hypothetical protein